MPQHAFAEAQSDARVHTRVYLVPELSFIEQIVIIGKPTKLIRNSLALRHSVSLSISRNKLSISRSAPECLRANRRLINWNMTAKWLDIWYTSSIAI